MFLHFSSYIKCPGATAVLKQTESIKKRHFCMSFISYEIDHCILQNAIFFPTCVPVSSNIYLKLSLIFKKNLSI